MSNFVKLAKPHFSPFWSKNLKTRFLKICDQILLSFTSHKNRKNLICWFFTNHENLILDPFWAFLALSVFLLDDTLTSCKKSENSYMPFQRKTLDKKTNRERVLYRTFTSWVQKSHDVFFVGSCTLLHSSHILSNLRSC